ncbi:MAG: protein translocase subunit SecD, partial [Alistipes sp.]|nr:protein translocase subunit SecD [Alistipes sp.]
NIGRPLAIIMDNVVFSAPNVNDRIDGGHSSITGGFTAQEAEDLANVLNSGKVPAPATIISQEVVGPSLGAESITAGLLSFVLAFVLVLLYMAFFYRTAGWMANIALIFNVLLLMGVLVSTGAVLTLPGIAGIVLTMGMAVDANVIIFERVKEELRGGKGLMLAIKDGFANAYSAIIDGNLTTIITGAVLFFFGTGPVKGFATTLVLGIITSLFCSIFVTRVLLEGRAERRGTCKFSSKFSENFLQNVKFSFIAKRKFSYIISGVLIIASVISLCTLGLNKGIDFTGGRQYVVKFDQTVSEDAIRENLEAAFASEDAANSSFEVMRIGNVEDNTIRIKTQFEPTVPALEENATAEQIANNNANYIIEEILYNSTKELFKDEITFEQFRSTQIDERGIESSQQVGGSISTEMTKNSFIAVLISLLAIGIYITIRFRRWQWALGATVALAHNAFLVIGIFSMLYAVMPFAMEINQAFIAAILTIIGYSINDTVVIFDRIREYIGLYPKRDIKTNIDNAICATLSRTVNTSMTTLVTLLAIFFFGGETIRGFVFALILGVVIGTYSSVFIATPIAYDCQRKKAAKAVEATEE